MPKIQINAFRICLLVVLGGLLSPGLASAQADDAPQYPYGKHLARISPHKAGYEYLRVKSEAKAAFWAVGVQTGILPDWYLGPFDPPLMCFPGIWVERGYRTYLPEGKSWDWIPHIRYTYLEWEQPNPDLAFPEAFWEGHGLSLGVKFMYNQPGPTFSAFGRDWEWYWYMGVGVQGSTRRQRSYLVWDENDGRYQTQERWQWSTLPGLTAHLGARLGRDR